MKKVLSFALSLVLVIAMVVTSMVFASASQTYTVTDLASIKTALSSAQDGDIINITGDITDAESLDITADVTLTGTGSITFTAGGFNVTNGANVTVTGGIYNAPGGDSNTYVFTVTKGTEVSSLTVDGGTFVGGFTAKDGIDAANTNKLTINDGTFTQSTKNILVNMDCAYTETVINGGTFLGAETSSNPMLKINNTNAKGSILGGSFTGVAAQPMVSLNNSGGFVIGKPDGTGPSMIQNGNTHLMRTDSGITSTADMTIYGGEFTQDKNWGYQIDFNHGMECKFEIAGGIFTSKAVVTGDMFRINDSGIKNFVISGGEFHQHSGESGASVDNAIVAKNNGALTVKGGSFYLYGANNKGAIIWTGSGKTNGALVIEGDKMFFDSKTTLRPVIYYQSGCPITFNNVKYTSESAMPFVTIELSSNYTNNITFNGCDFNTAVAPICISGPNKANVVLDDNTKIVSKAYAFDNQNGSTIVLNNAQIISKKLININNAANGNLTMFVTAEPEQVYVYTYTRTKANLVAPYIEAVMANGTTQKLEVIETLEDQNNLKSTTVKFKTPAGLADENNLRIGVEAGATPVTVSLDSFSVRPTDKFDMITYTELVDTDKINATTKLIPYADNAANSTLMIEGGFDATNTEILAIGGATFDLPDAQIMIFRGTNGSDKFKISNGGGYIYQDVAVEAGKTYRLTGNIKYASAGYDIVEGQKMGFEVSYKKSGNFFSLGMSKLPEDANEYKETYLFTVPADVDAGDKNLKVAFHFSNAFVSGYATNFSLVEVDATTSAVRSEEILTNGNFGAELNSWTTAGSYYKIFFNEITVENYFSKINPPTPGMLQFSASDDYARHDQVIVVKPGHTYEIMYQGMFPVTNPDNSPRMILYNTLYNEDRSDSSGVYVEYEDEENSWCKLDVLENNYYRYTYEAPENLRIHGDTNVTLRIYTFKNTAGYFGEITVYELDENGNRVGNNIAVNGDWLLSDKMWVTGNTKKYATKQQVPGFLDEYVEPETMIYADGTGANQNYTTTLTVDADKSYTFSGYYIGMNSAGVNPRILYQSRKANGAYEVLETTTYYDSNIYYFEVNFELPEDAVVKNGEAIIKVQMNNGKNGKGYFRELRLAESNKFENLISTMSGGSTFKEMPYDSGVFIFYYDDAKFDDGDWSGELAGVTATTGAVSGRVVNSKEEAISGMTVMIGTASVKTDEGGNYSATNLKPGKYDIYLVEANGNKLLCYTVEVKAGILSSIPLITYFDASELTFELTDEDTTDSDSENTTEQTPYGALRGYYLDKDGKPIKGAKIYLKGLGFVTTNNKGMFEFSKLPVGEYEVYTKLADGSTHVFRKVTIEAYKGALIKVVEPAVEGGFNWLWVIIPSAVVVLAGAAFVTILVIKKKKIK